VWKVLVRSYPAIAFTQQYPSSNMIEDPFQFVDTKDKSLTHGAGQIQSADTFFDKPRHQS